MKFFRFIVAISLCFSAPSSLACRDLASAFDIWHASKNQNIFELHDALRANGVATEYIYESKTYAEYLQVKTEGSSQLNHFASYLDHAYQGLKLILDPNIKPLGMYQVGKHTIVMGHKFIRNLANGRPLATISTTLRHELVHARLTMRNKARRASIFDGFLESKSEGGFGLPSYNEGFSYQEFAAFGWQVFYHLRQAKTLERKNQPAEKEITALLKRIATFRSLLRVRKKFMPEIAEQIAQRKFKLTINNYGGGLFRAKLKFEGLDCNLSFIVPKSFSRMTSLDQHIKVIKLFEFVDGNSHKIEKLGQQFDLLEQRLKEGARASSIDAKKLQKGFRALVR